MPKVDLPIGGGFYQSESLPISAQRCINWFPTVPQTPNAASRVVLFHTPGQKAFSSPGSANRGLHVMDDAVYSVNGSTLYSISTTGVATSLGTIAGSGKVSMADNGSKLVIVVPGLVSYVYDGVALVEITDGDFRQANTVCFKDGYFVFTASDGSVFFNSALNDPLNYRALDFGTAEINPDKIVACHVTHNELFIIGTETIELFQNIGGADFPFQRIQGANIQKGAHATFGIVGLDETFAFVGGGKDEKTAIYQVADSTRATKISTPAIDNAIQKFTQEEISNCFAMTYFDRGSQIAIFTFESNRIPSRTFAFNATASRLAGVPTWFEFQSGVADGRWNVNSIVVAYGKVLAGTSNGAVAELDHSTYTDLGAPIKRQFTSGPISSQDNPIFISEVVLWMEAGVGTTGQGLDPQVSMDYSDDGIIFGNNRVRSIGKKGRFEQQTSWRRNGRAPAYRVLRFTITDPVKPVIRKLQAIINAGGPVG